MKLKTIRKVRLRLVLMVAAVSVFTGAFGAWTAWRDRQASLDASFRQTAAYAKAMEALAARVLGEADTVVRDGAVDIRREGGVGAMGAGRLRALLLEEISATDMVASLSVVDRRGIVVASTRAEGVPPSLDVSDREYFRHHRDRGGAGPFLSRPFAGRLSGKLRFTLSRRLEAPGGAFDGCLVAAFDVAQFGEIYGAIAGPLGPGARIHLLRTDGRSIVFHPLSDNAMRMDWSRMPILSVHLPKAPAGSFATTVPALDGTRRIVSYDRLEGYPLVAVVSVARDEALARWAARSRLTFLVVVLLLAAVWALTAYLLRRLSDLEGALEREKVLGGLLPICSICKKIRDDAGYWQQIEAYIHAHSEAEFSHGVCPSCMDRHYPGILGGDDRTD